MKDDHPGFVVVALWASAIIIFLTLAPGTSRDVADAIGTFQRMLRGDAISVRMVLGILLPLGLIMAGCVVAVRALLRRLP